MSKFKVGDKVTPILKDGESSKNLPEGWVGQMMKYVGKEGRIKSVFNKIVPIVKFNDGYEWSFFEDQLAKVESEKEKDKMEEKEQPKKSFPEVIYLFPDRDTTICILDGKFVGIAHRRHGNKNTSGDRYNKKIGKAFAYAKALDNKVNNIVDVEFK